MVVSLRHGDERSFEQVDELPVDPGVAPLGAGSDEDHRLARASRSPSPIALALGGRREKGQRRLLMHVPGR